MTTLPPWSYTFLSTYQNCPHQAFHRYIAKDVLYVETAATKWGNDVHSAMDKRIAAGVPLSGDTAKFEPLAAAFVGKPVETELRMGVRENSTVCGFYDKDCFGHMKLDLIYTPGDMTIRLFDWKTGSVREDPFELRLQALFVQARTPDVRVIRGWYVWLGQGPAGKLGAPHDLSDVERTWAEVNSMMHTIRANAAINHWPKKEGPLCKWCSVKSCEFNRAP